MNYEEFCKRLNETPDEDFEGREEQIATCPDSARYHREAQAFEAKLRRALEVPVPDFAMPDLKPARAPDVAEPQRLDPAFEAKLKRALKVPVPHFDLPDLTPASDTSRVVSLDARRPARKAGMRPASWLALAASVALAAIIGFRFVDQSEAPDAGRPRLVAEVLGHMDHEREEMRVKTTPASIATVRYVTSSAGSDVDKDIGLISYARSCVVNGRAIPHLVLQGKNGPVTLLIMPDEPVARLIPFEDEDFHGAIVPVGETGSVAIIGRRGEPLDEIRDTIANKIRLSI